MSDEGRSPRRRSKRDDSYSPQQAEEEESESEGVDGEQQQFGGGRPEGGEDDKVSESAAEVTSELEQRARENVDESGGGGTGGTSQSGAGGNIQATSGHAQAGGEDQPPKNDPTTGLESDGPSTGEFARQSFSEGARARRIRDGEDGQRAVPIEEEGRSGRVGGWSEYGEDTVTLKKGMSGEKGGRTSEHMEIHDLGPAVDADSAFVTNYGLGGPNASHKRNQMGVYAALDAMGVKTPAHTYDAEADQVIVEGVGREDYEVQRADEVTPEFANRVDPDEVTDVLAANALVGNVDLKADNVMIGEDGGVQPFDYDWTDKHLSVAGAESSLKGSIGAAPTLRSIDLARDGGLDVSVSDVVDRAEELAFQMEQTGMTETVAQSAGKYEDFIDEQTGKEAGSRIDDRIRSHVELFAESYRN